MGKKIRSVVRTLVRVGVIDAQGRNYSVKLTAKDQTLVNCPRGEAALSRDLAQKYGAKRVLLVYADNANTERTASGNKVALSAMGRYLLDNPAKK